MPWELGAIGRLPTIPLEFKECSQSRVGMGRKVFESQISAALANGHRLGIRGENRKKLPLLPESGVNLTQVYCCQ